MALGANGEVRAVILGSIPSVPKIFFSASAPPRSFSLFSSFSFKFTIGRYNLLMLGFEPQISGVGKRPLCQLSHHHCPKVKLGQ